MSIKFIKDKEFDLSNSNNEDLLGTKPYAETLFEVIKESSGKQNIGLFGGWGSGKSTIIETLHNFILESNSNKKNEQIAFFKYDAWKYSNDDFRRSFLKSLNSEFKAIDAKDLDKKLYQDISREDTKNATINVNIGNVILYVISLLFLLLCVYYVLPSVISSTEKLALAIFSVLTTFLFAVSRDTFRVTPFTIRESKIIEAEKFEDTFKLITNNIFGISSNLFKDIKNTLVCKDIYKKIVIVIDNLDRCDNENLKETLSSMKNFLENSKIIFVLPVDENGITCFLDIDIDDSDEYLRKIFHQIIRLKKFTPKELDEFTSKLNKKYELELSNTGIRLICQEFTTNPRKIIQFLNNLQTERDLIKRQIAAKYINLEFNEQADDFLIKLLIIKQEWSEIYKSILDDVNYLNKLNKALSNTVEHKDSKYHLTAKNSSIILSRDQKRFFKRNISVHFKNIEPFILNIDRDKDVPDELKEYIENGELKEALEILSIVDEKDFNETNIKLLLSQIENVYDYNSNKFDDYNFIALPVSEILFELLENENVKSEIKISIKNYGFIDRIFDDNQFSSLIPTLNNYEKYCLSAKWFHEELNYKIPYHRLFNYLNDSINPGLTIEGIHDKIAIFIDIFRDNEELLLGLRKNLKNKISKEPILLTTSYKIFEKDVEIAHNLLDSDFMNVLFELLNQNKIDDKKTINSIKNLADGYINKNYIENPLIFTAYSNYLLKTLKSEFDLKSASVKGVFELHSIVDSLNKILSKSDINALKVETDVFDNILQELNSEYNSSLTKDEVQFYISFFNMILTYMHLNNDFGDDTNFEKYFNVYFNKTDFKELSLEINKIYQKEINHFSAYSWTFFDEIISKLKAHFSIEFYKTLMLMFNKTNSKKGLTKNQNEILIDNIIKYFLTYAEYSALTKLSSDWLSLIYKKEKDLFLTAIDNLNSKDFEDYVYNIYKLNKEEFIGNSFVKYLNSLDNFKRFERFVRFVGEKHSSKIQENLLLEVSSTKYPPFDWIFSANKTIIKSVLNKLIIKYLENYHKTPVNTDYLKNLLKINKSDLYPGTIENIFELINNLKNPTKRHNTKIASLKNKLK